MKIHLLDMKFKRKKKQSTHYIALKNIDLFFKNAITLCGSLLVWMFNSLWLNLSDIGKI